MNSSYNSKDSNDVIIEEEEEKYSTDQNLSESNYISYINNNSYISKKYKIIELNDDKDKLILIKKQTKLISHLKLKIVFDKTNCIFFILIKGLINKESNKVNEYYIFKRAITRGGFSGECFKRYKSYFNIKNDNMSKYGIII